MRTHQAEDFPLLNRACRGDRQALNILIEFCQPCLHRAIGRLCHRASHLEIDDMVQETWHLLLKDHCRVFSQYEFNKGDLGAFLFGVAARVVHTNERRKARSGVREISLARIPSRELPVSDAQLQQVIEDLSTEATAAENRFLQQSLLRVAEQNTSYSAANRRQLTHRLFEKAWPLVYESDVLRSRPRKRPRRSPRPAKSRKGKAPSKRDL